MDNTKDNTKFYETLNVELAALRAENATLKKALFDLLDAKDEYWLSGEGFTPERCKELLDLYCELI